MGKTQPSLKGERLVKRTKQTLACFCAMGLTTLMPLVKLFAQVVPVPAISYSNPQTYFVGSPINPLTPVNTGGTVAAPAYNSDPITLTFGMYSQYFVAVDAAGNVYTTNLDGTSVTKYPVGNYGNYVAIGSGFVNPTGIAIDAAGNLYVADAGTNVVKKIPAGSNTPIIIQTGFGNPQGVAVDAQGNVYVADAGSGTVFEIPVTGGSTIPLYTGLNYPGGSIEGIAVDAQDNIYVTNPGMNWIMKMVGNTGYLYTYTLTGLNGPYGITVDAEGNLFVVNSGGQIQELKTPLTNTSVPIDITAFLQPYGIAVDGAGNLYMTGTHSPELLEDKPVGGYYLNTALPAGLSFNNTTGVISGTPTVASPATNYTVTAYNTSGSSSATVNIKVTGNSNSNLSALTISNGTLTPAFASGTTSYTVSEANSVGYVLVRPTAGDQGATITVNGTAVASGSLSGQIPLSVGSNPISVVVTAQDGVTIKTYTITAIRAPSAVASLSALTISAGTLTPAFTTGTTSYTVPESNTITSITVKPTTTSTVATVTVNGTVVTSGTSSGSITLAVGPNNIQVVVTAQDGTTNQTYTITATRAPGNANLSALSISNGTLTPAFASGTTSYTVSEANSVASVLVRPTASDAGATIKVNGTTVASGTLSGQIPLSVGSNPISVVVTASDGVTIQTYTITATRAPSAVASLSNLTVSAGTLTPVFATGTTSYTVSEVAGTTSVTVKPSTTSTTATVKVNGTAVTSGTSSQSIPLAIGPNTITTVVTAQDGTTTETYTLTVTVKGTSTNANLSALTISNGTLTPAFVTGTTSYTVSEANSVANVYIRPTASDAGATITVNGTAVASGVVSGKIPLLVGSNNITVVVTASDEVTTKTYTITATRAPGGGDAYNPGISVTKPTESAMMAEDGIVIHQGISPNGDGINDYLQIDNIGQYPDNKLTIMNRNGQLVYEARGYDNSSKTFDGHSNKNGQLQLPGTYFYELEYTVKGIAKHKTGFIVLKY